MDRKSFLRRLGLGIATIVAAPHILAGEVKREPALIVTDGAKGVGKIKPHTPNTLEFDVTNSNDYPTPAMLFNSCEVRFLENYGNPAGIKIECTDPDKTYTHILAFTECKYFECGKTMVEVLEGDPAGVSAHWSFHDVEIRRGCPYPVIRTILPLQMGPENLNDKLLTTDFTHVVTGLRGLQITIPAKTKIRYTFFPSQPVNTPTLTGPLYFSTSLAKNI